MKSVERISKSLSSVEENTRGQRDPSEPANTSNMRMTSTPRGQEAKNFMTKEKEWRRSERDPARKGLEKKRIHPKESSGPGTQDRRWGA